MIAHCNGHGMQGESKMLLLQMIRHTKVPKKDRFETKVVLN
jgi:hypothetical protein